MPIGVVVAHEPELDIQHRPAAPFLEEVVAAQTQRQRGWKGSGLGRGLLDDERGAGDRSWREDRGRRSGWRRWSCRGWSARRGRRRAGATTAGAEAGGAAGADAGGAGVGAEPARASRRGSRRPGGPSWPGARPRRPSPISTERLLGGDRVGGLRDADLAGGRAERGDQHAVGQQAAAQPEPVLGPGGGAAGASFASRRPRRRRSACCRPPAVGPGAWCRRAWPPRAGHAWPARSRRPCPGGCWARAAGE